MVGRRTVKEGMREPCKECLSRCRLTHGKQSQQHRSAPTAIAFFKVMIGHFSEFLFLPPKFIREALALGGQSTLEDMRGQQWKVKLSIVNGSLAFQQGWSKFVSEHNVQFGEILIFNYISESYFLVQIFGTCGCERSNFSTRNEGDHEKEKRSRKIEPSPTKMPPMKMPCSMVETRAMKKLKAMESVITPENLNGRMTRSKCHVELTGKPMTMLEDSAEDNENSRFDDPETTGIMINKSQNNRKVTVEGEMPCDASDVGKLEVNEKAPISTKNSNYASSSRGASDASDLPLFIAVDVDPSVANKCNAEKVNGLSLTASEKPTKHEGLEEHPCTHEKVCCISHKDTGNGKDIVRASFSLESADAAEVGNRCDAKATEKLTTMGNKSFSYDTIAKSNLDMAKVPCNKDGGNSVDEKREGKSTISPSKSSYLLSDHVVSLSDRNAPAVANVQLGMEDSSYEVFSSKMRSDAFQMSFDKKMDIDEGDMKKPSHPSNAKCEHVYGNSISEVGDAIWSKCNVAQNSVVKYPDHISGSKTKQIMDYGGDSNLRNGHGEWIKETIHSNSSSFQAIASKCEGVGEETREKSHNNCFKIISDASQNLCYKNDKNLVSKDGAANHETTPTSLPDIGIAKAECADEEMDKVLTGTGGTNHSKNLSAFASSELPCDVIDGNIEEEGVARTDIASISNDLNGGKCNADDSESMHFTVDGAMVKEDRDVRSQTAPSDFIGLKLSETNSHYDTVDKGKEMTNNSSHLETSSIRIQTMSLIGGNSPVKGSPNICGTGISKCSPSKEQTIPHPGNELNSVLEEGNINSCSEAVLKQCNIEPEETLDSIFSCSIDKRCQFRLELPQCIDYSVTKNKKKYDKVVVLLRDPSMRVWPVLYHENRFLKIFGSGWSSFAKANNLQEGDTCTFQVADALEALVQVQIKRVGSESSI